MAYAGIMTTTAAIFAKTSTAVSSNWTEAMYNEAVKHAESVVNVATRKDWSAIYADTSTAVSRILSDAVSSLAAIEGIGYHMGSYPSRIVAEDLINVNRDIALRNISILRDSKSKEFVEANTA